MKNTKIRVRSKFHCEAFDHRSLFQFREEIGELQEMGISIIRRRAFQSI